MKAADWKEERTATPNADSRGVVLAHRNQHQREQLCAAAHVVGHRAERHRALALWHASDPVVLHADRAREP